MGSQPKTICVKCKWIRTGAECASPDTILAKQAWLSYVTGVSMLPRCDKVNTDGNCLYYEPKLSWWHLIRRLWR